MAHLHLVNQNTSDPQDNLFGNQIQIEGQGQQNPDASEDIDDFDEGEFYDDEEVLGDDHDEFGDYGFEEDEEAEGGDLSN